MKKKRVVKHRRPSWDEYFVDIMNMVGSRATCDRGRSGCVVVKNKRILTTGYVGSPIGIPHCDDIGHEMQEVVNDDETVSHHCVRTIHAEQNAIAQSARIGICLEGATHCKMTPCYICAKLIINVGIIRVVALKDYHRSQKTKEIFKKCKIALVIIDGATETYENQ